jgi:diadenosine tetraphosphate (Ap4A) HIT family hydrolase
MHVVSAVSPHGRCRELLLLAKVECRVHRRLHNTTQPKPSVLTRTLPITFVSRTLFKMATDANCIFCKIIAGKIPSMKLYETEKSYAFLDIGPIAKKHCLVIPKYHGAKLADVPDEHLEELLPIAKKLAIASGAQDYNILQNNGRIAHQMVDHVHVHMIPKPNEEQGLIVGWPTQETEKEELQKIFEEIKQKL